MTVKLIDAFFPVIQKTIDLARILHKEKTSDQDPIQLSIDLAQNLEDIKKDLIKQGRHEHDLDLAIFAIVAWIDEVFGRYPDWSRGYKRLQTKFFTTNNAGNEFFEKCESLDDRQQEIIEIYYQMLRLGFVGEHYLKEDAGKLEQISATIRKRLQAEKIETALLDQQLVTPALYSVQNNKPLALGFAWWPMLVGFLSVMAVGLLFWMVFALWGPSQEDVLALVDSELKNYECATFKNTVDVDLNVTLHGFVHSKRDQARLRDFLNSQQEEGMIHQFDMNGIKHIPRPHCNLYTVLRNHYIKPLDNIENIPTPQNKSVVFKAGESLKLPISNLRPGHYLYVSYVQSDGNIVHMFPVPDFADNRIKQKNIVIGNGSLTDRIYNVEAPFGLDMVLVILSQEPLFDIVRPEIEDSNAYLRALNQKLEQLIQDGKPLPLFEMTFVQTVQ